MLFSTKDHTGQEAAIEQTDQGQGEPQIGGDFILTDQAGNTVSETDFRGRLMLVFFGFTHCPDICPVSVTTLSKVMEQLGSDADQVAPVFITVDPARDTPPVMAEYLANFDKRMVGLTGTPEQIAQVAETYKAYYALREAPVSDAHAEHKEHREHGGHDAHEGREANAAKNYIVDHSGYIYLMDKNGKFMRLFPYNTEAGEITRAVQCALRG